MIVVKGTTLIVRENGVSMKMYMRTKFKIAMVHFSTLKKVYRVLFKKALLVYYIITPFYSVPIIILN